MSKIMVIFLLLSKSSLATSWPEPNNCSCELSIQQVISLDPTDCHSNDGLIKIIATDKNTNLEYSIDGGGSWQSTPVFTDLGEGVYLIAIKPTNSQCTVYYTDLVILMSPPPPFFAEVIFTHPSQSDRKDGTIQIKAEGGTGSFEFSIDGGQHWQGIGIFSELPIGTYELQIRNSDHTCKVDYKHLITLC